MADEEPVIGAFFVILIKVWKEKVDKIVYEIISESEEPVS